MAILLGSDHAGAALRHHLSQYVREELAQHVSEMGPNAEEGVSVDYPDIAWPLAQRVAAGEGLGILICGTGVGVSIVANKVPGIRCALVTDPYTARLSREHNDANLLALGARVIGTGIAAEIVTTWLATPFAGGRHQSRLTRLCALERGE